MLQIAKLSLTKWSVHTPVLFNLAPLDCKGGMASTFWSEGLEGFFFPFVNNSLGHFMESLVAFSVGLSKKQSKTLT